MSKALLQEASLLDRTVSMAVLSLGGRDEKACSVSAVRWPTMRPTPCFVGGAAKSYPPLEHRIPHTLCTLSAILNETVYTNADYS